MAARPVTTMSAIAWYNRAAAAMQGGDRTGARTILADALAEYPQDAKLWHGAGKVLLELGEADEAARHFGKAFELQPGNFDYAVDRAIALSGANRNREAIAVLRTVEMQGAGFAHYCSTRGNAERGAGDLAASQKWYDRALSIEPSRSKALQGRANVALERGEDDAVAWFDRALAVEPGNPYNWLGKAQALEVAGDVAGARRIIEQVVEQAPAWLDGHKFLAQLRLAAGEEDFTSHYGNAMVKVPGDPNIPDAWCRVLAGLDYNIEAADVAARAKALHPQSEHFALLEAIHAGAGGDDARAEALFAGISLVTLDRLTYEARHRIRLREYDRAGELLDRAVKLVPDDVGMWALRGILWRLTDDARKDWLHGQDGLHGLAPLRNAEKVLPPVIELLHRLHGGSTFPLGQSLRGGTQTRGRLFDRKESEFQALRDAIFATVEDYRRSLPAEDATHPLLRHRAEPWRIAGSWSVRLDGGGDHHTSHIHPQGIVSSALYLSLPPETAGDGQRGWLELGRPPPDLRLDLPPLAVIQPEEGHLALFPSTLYHGTTPFGDGRRMTVAFDVALADR